MTHKRHPYDAVQWHMDEITSRIIAESGIPSDRFHLGKIILQCLKDDPDTIAQIDGATGKSETNASMLKRSIQCAASFRKLGLQQGDVIMLMAPNHLDLSIPFYAALFEGIIIAPVDMGLGVSELQDALEVSRPKCIFCQSGKVGDIKEALKKKRFVAKVISFDKGNDNFDEFLQEGNNENTIRNYKPTDIDPEEAIALLISTSGTTGLPKSAATTHKNFVVMEPVFWCRTTKVPYYRSSLVAAPLQWLSALINFISAPIVRFTRIQSSLPMTQENVYYLINTYKPEFVVISPTMMTTLMKPGDREKCDFTCFKSICVGGSAVYEDLISEISSVAPETEVIALYGMSELTNMAFSHGFSSPPHCCGKPLRCLQYRLVDPETGKDIYDANKNGELWLKGPGIFKGYYNNPEATKETFADDGWFKTGDILFRDESWNFFFVDRMKLLLKYRNYQISPVEVERIIRRHPSVLDVAVTGIPDRECGDLPVACVVLRPGYNVTAQQIKDLVRENLADTKQLRGGVVFMDQLPLTASTKLHRRKIKEMVLTMKRE